MVSMCHVKNNGGCIFLEAIWKTVFSVFVNVSKALFPHLILMPQVCHVYRHYNSFVVALESSEKLSMQKKIPAKVV